MYLRDLGLGSQLGTGGTGTLREEHLLQTRRIAVALYSLMALGVFAAYAIQIVNHFYFSGAPSYDAGLFAYAMSRFDLPPSNPLYMQERGIPSFFAFHVAPIMPLWGAFAQLAGLAPPIAFAAYQGFFHAILALAGAGLANTWLAEPWNLLFRQLVGLSLAFSPIALGAIGFPHHELAIPILFIVTCYALSRGRRFLAAISFVLMLFVRTDAGFHASCFLVAFATGELITARQFSPTVRRALMLAAIAFAYSCAAFVILHAFFPQFDNFRFSYSGPGFFAHLNIPLLQERIGLLLEKRPELFVIFAVTAALGLVKRDISILLGTGAILPWVILHISAYRAPPGELYTYYAFPFLILLAWPWLVTALRQVGKGDVNSRKQHVAIGVATAWVGMCVAAWLAYFSTPFMSDRSMSTERSVSASHFLPKVGFKTARVVSGFSTTLGQLIGSSGTLIVIDEAMISLLPNTGRSNLFREGKGQSPATDQPFVVAYFSTYMHAGALEKSYYASAADACFSVNGTNIRILERGSGNLVRSTFGHVTEPLDCDLIRRR